jgi:hypothetical protein
VEDGFIERTIREKCEGSRRRWRKRTAVGGVFAAVEKNAANE